MTSRGAAIPERETCPIIKMKVAVVFLIAAFASSFEAASVTRYNCLEQLFKNDAPLLLQSMATLLCDYKLAKSQQNAELFEQFLIKVNALLEKVGCTIDNILGTNVTITLQDAEQLGDNVANILFGFLESIIAKVTKILDDIPFMVIF
ncbi:hypothetical protein GDO81_010547 [Engystomops pustulosus]|uniref:Uncharacterized protein n=1 Tax=Engystomops pustulosus TaxID=76066 RepID=A0AAV7C0X7_ENGPU|nr:hypothetical protein GDO81_010547 [Engystomops pustulosus]